MASKRPAASERRAGRPAAANGVGPPSPPRSRLGSRRGSELIEFSLVLLPMMGFTFLFLDIAWAVFARSVLQNAVREGARYAVTSRVETGMGHVASIKSVVQRNAVGVLGGQAGQDAIHVRFYSPETFTDISEVNGANAGGNLVEVSVEGFPWAPLAPLMRNRAALSFTARSMDRMEASPANGPPEL